MPWVILCRDIKDLQSSNALHSYKGYSLDNFELSRLKTQIANQKYLIDSYFTGTSPENKYAVNLNNVEFNFSSNSYSGNPAEGYFKLFALSSGADSPRPATLSRNDKGIWKVKEYSSLILSIRKPAEQIVDDL